MKQCIICDAHWHWDFCRAHWRSGWWGNTWFRWGRLSPTSGKCAGTLSQSSESDDETIHGSSKAAVYFQYHFESYCLIISMQISINSLDILHGLELQITHHNILQKGGTLIPTTSFKNHLTWSPMVLMPGSSTGLNCKAQQVSADTHWWCWWGTSESYIIFQAERQSIQGSSNQWQWIHWGRGSGGAGWSIWWGWGTSESDIVVQAEGQSIQGSGNWWWQIWWGRSSGGQKPWTRKYSWRGYCKSSTTNPSQRIGNADGSSWIPCHAVQR